MNIDVCKLRCWHTDRWRCWEFILTSDLLFIYLFIYFFVPHILLRSKRVLSRVLVVGARTFFPVPRRAAIYEPAARRRGRRRRRRAGRLCKVAYAHLPQMLKENKPFTAPFAESLGSSRCHAESFMPAEICMHPGGALPITVATYTALFCSSRVIDVSNVLPPVRSAEKQPQGLRAFLCESDSAGECVHASNRAAEGQVCQF